MPLPDVEYVHQRRRTVRLVIVVAAAAFLVAFYVSNLIGRLGGKIIFDEHYPLSQALATQEREGLLLSIHELVPFENGGYFVITSVRGTPEFLAKYPPSRRRLRPLETTIDVADHATSGPMLDGLQLMLARADKHGIQYVWWLMLPRRYFGVVDGKRVPVDSVNYLEPGMFPVGEEKVRIPFRGFYWSDRLKDERGVLKGFLAWLEMPVPRDRLAATLADVAARTRNEMRVIQQGSYATMFGGGPGTARGALDHFDPDRITDAAYEAALKQQIEWFQGMNEVREPMEGALNLPINK